MVKVVLFDVDGVLVNGTSFSSHLLLDYHVTPEMTAPFFSTVFLDCLVGTADLKLVIKEYLPRWGWTGSVDDFLAYWFACEHVIDQALVSSVQRLREDGIRCYLATQQERYRAAYIMENMGFSDLFDGLFVSASLGMLKTDPAFFSTILNVLDDTAASDMLFWDDSPRNVEAARQAGLQAEVYTNLDSFLLTMRQHYALLPHAQAD